MSFFVLDDSTAEAKMPILLTRVDRNLRIPYGSGPHPYSGSVVLRPVFERLGLGGTSDDTCRIRLRSEKGSSSVEC